MKIVLSGSLGLALVLAAQPVRAQILSLEAARDAARRSSPYLVAAREGVSAARARERQATAFPNPVFAWSREQTSAGGQTNSQNIFSLEQPLEITGQRSARRDAARLRREAAEAMLAAAEARTDYDVTRAYALAVAADRRAVLANVAAAAFTRALTVSQQRLAAGDVSGYVHRRVRLEAARYATVRAEEVLARRAARLALAELLASHMDSATVAEWTLSDSLPPRVPAGDADSLRRLALSRRAELRAADLEARALEADARLAGRERIPVPVLAAGFKNERAIGSADDLSGFVAGVSLPLPLFDRRRGGIEAAEADARRRTAENDALRRHVVREVAEAFDAVSVVEQQLELIGPQLGEEASAALRAAQVAYTEGEISLVEWLDAVRAYQEAEATFADLRAEAVIRRAALLRAVGLPANPPSRN